MNLWRKRVSDYTLYCTIQYALLRQKGAWKIAGTYCDGEKQSSTVKHTLRKQEVENTSNEAEMAADSYITIECATRQNVPTGMTI